MDDELTKKEVLSLFGLDDVKIVSGSEARQKWASCLSLIQQQQMQAITQQHELDLALVEVAINSVPRTKTKKNQHKLISLLAKKWYLQTRYAHDVLKVQGTACKVGKLYLRFLCARAKKCIGVYRKDKEMYDAGKKSQEELCAKIFEAVTEDPLCVVIEKTGDSWRFTFPYSADSTGWNKAQINLFCEETDQMVFFAGEWCKDIRVHNESDNALYIKYQYW